MEQARPGGHRTLGERMVEAARQLQDEADPQSTMEAAVRLAAANIAGCDAAALSIVERGKRLETPASTAPMALAGDTLQYALGEGPCLDAAWEERVVHSADLFRESRWPAWASRVAHDHGARSVLCFQLFTHAETLGALNLYSTTRGAFNEEDRDEGLALAGHIAIAVLAARKTEQLTQALDARTTIGQACGILMERYDLDPTRAFEVLARVSSESNVKLREIARELVETRRLPGGQA